MKRILTFPFLAAFLLPFSSVSAEEICPLPRGMQASIGAARQVVEAKNAGVSKVDLISKIPSNQNEKWLSLLLREMVEEVYGYATLRPEVYAAYRFEYCFAAQKDPGAVSKIKFSDAHPLLQKCDLIEQEGARPPCAMKVLHAVSDIPE